MAAVRWRHGRHRSPPPQANASCLVSNQQTIREAQLREDAHSDPHSARAEWRGDKRVESGVLRRRPLEAGVSAHWWAANLYELSSLVNWQLAAHSRAQLSAEERSVMATWISEATKWGK